MLGLIIIFLALTAVSIALTAVAHTILPAKTMEQAQTVAQLKKDLRDYQDGVGRYLSAQKIRIEPKAPETISPGFYIPWEQLATLDLRAAISPEYMHEPRSLPNMQWSVEMALLNEAPAVLVCLSPQVGYTPDEQTLQNIETATSSFTKNLMVLGDDCGASSNTPTGTHLNIWIPVENYAAISSGDSEEEEQITPPDEPAPE